MINTVAIKEQYRVSFKDRHKIVQEDSVRGKAYDARYSAAYSFLSRFVKNKGTLIADLGCGDGVFLSRIIDEYPNLIGLDLSVKSLNYIRRQPRMKDITLINRDIEDLPFENDELPIVVCTEALEHLIDVEKGLKEIHRVLKPNGILIVTVPFALNPRNTMAVGNHESKFFSYLRGLYRVISEMHRGYVIHTWRDSQGLEFPHRVYFKDKVKSMIEKADFNVRQITKTPLFISNRNGRSLGVRMERLVSVITSNYFGETIVILAQKRV